jgi:hypothetical protein
MNSSRSADKSLVGVPVTIVAIASSASYISVTRRRSAANPLFLLRDARDPFYLESGRFRIALPRASEATRLGNWSSSSSAPFLRTLRLATRFLTLLRFVGSSRRRHRLAVSSDTSHLAKPISASVHLRERKSRRLVPDVFLIGRPERLQQSLPGLVTRAGSSKQLSWQSNADRFTKERSASGQRTAAGHLFIELNDLLIAWQFFDRLLHFFAVQRRGRVAH